MGKIEATFVIEENCISISNEHTSYVMENRRVLVTREVLEETIKKLKSLAKADKRVQLKGINASVRTLREQWCRYAETVKSDNELFDQLVVISKVLEAEGLVSPTCDNETLRIINRLRHDRGKTCYRDTFYSKYLEMYRRLHSVILGLHYTHPTAIRIKYVFSNHGI